MKTKKSQQKLAAKIHKIKEIIKHLENLKNNPEAGVISQLLKMMSSLFEEVDQRLTELEK